MILSFHIFNFSGNIWELSIRDVVPSDSLTSTRFIEVPTRSQESEQSFISLLGNPFCTFFYSFDWILEMLRQCGIFAFFFHFIMSFMCLFLFPSECWWQFLSSTSVLPSSDIASSFVIVYTFYRLALKPWCSWI